MADHDNMQAQNFKNGFSTANVDKVKLPSNSKNSELLSTIKQLVVESARDLYGGPDDPKYKYIVNLIIKRVKLVLDDLNVSSDLSSIAKTLSDIQEEFKISTDNIKSLISDRLDEMKSSFEDEMASLKAMLDGSQGAQASRREEEKSSKDEEVEDTSLDKESIVSTICEFVQTVSTRIESTITTQFASLNTQISYNFAMLGEAQRLMSVQMMDLTKESRDQLNGLNSKMMSNQLALLVAKNEILAAVQSMQGNGGVEGNIAAGVASIKASFNIAIAAVQSAVGAVNGALKKSMSTIASIGKKLPSLFSSFKDSLQQSLSDKSLLLKSTISGLSNSITKKFSNVGKQLKKIQSSISSALSAVAETAIKGVSLLLGPIGTAVSAVFGMISFVFKPLKWLIGLFKNPIVLFVAAAAFLVPLFLKYKAKIKKFYDEKIKPVIEKVTGILGDDSLPLGKRLKKAAVEGGKALWRNLFPKGLGGFFKETVLPMFTNNVLPFLKDNWKTILAGIGMTWLLTNPISAILSPIKLIKGAVFGIKAVVALIKGAVMATKVVVGAAKLAASGGSALVGKLGALLVGVGPVGWAALATGAVAGGVFYYFWKKAEDMKQAIADEMHAQFKETFQNELAVKNKLDEVNGNINKTFDKFGSVLEAQGIIKPEDQQPELFDYVNEKGEKIKADRETIQELMKKHAEQSEYTKARLSNLDQMMKDGSFGDFDQTSASKKNILGHYFAKIKGLIVQTRGFINSYIVDPSNLVDDPGIGSRHKEALDIIKKSEESTYNLLSKYADETKKFMASGSNDQWRSDLSSLESGVANDMKKAISKLVTRADGKGIFGQNAVKMTNSIMTNMQLKVDKAANSRKKEDIEELFNSEVNVYHDTLGKKYANAVKNAEEQMNSQLDSLGIAKDATKVSEGFRKRMTELAGVAAKSAMTQNGGKALTPEELKRLQDGAIVTMYEELQQKLKQNPNDASTKLLLKQLEEKSDAVKGLNSGLKELQDKGLDLNQFDQADKEGIQAALRTMFKTTELKNGKLDLENAENKEKLLAEVKAQLEKNGGDDKKHKQLMEMMAKMLNAQTNLQKSVDEKEAGSTTNVNVTGIVPSSDNQAALANQQASLAQ